MFYSSFLPCYVVLILRLSSVDGAFIRFAEIVFAYDEGTPKVKQVYKLL